MILYYCCYYYNFFFFFWQTTRDLARNDRNLANDITAIYLLYIIFAQLSLCYYNIAYIYYIIYLWVLCTRVKYYHYHHYYARVEAFDCSSIICASGFINLHNILYRVVRISERRDTTGTYIMYMFNNNNCGFVKK